MGTSNRSFNRDDLIKELGLIPQWDNIIIGGGATGLGAGVDSASRGYKTLVLEQCDFGKGTSSRSTKLVHGGVRYLAQGDIGLVREALKERGLLFKNAPHLVKKQAFIIPCYSFFSKMKYLIGLKLYDWLSGKFSFGRSTLLSKNNILAAMPQIQRKGLQGGIEYFDGQFDDARLAVNLAQTCVEQGGTVLNYAKVIGLLKDQQGTVNGVRVLDIESQKEYSLFSKVVINATGVFVDDILKMDSPHNDPLVRPSQGVHIVLDKSFLKGGKALMIPKTPDGRVLFAVPWHEHIIVGTTDTPLNSHSLEPVPLEAEIDFILNTAGKYLSNAPKRPDVLSVFAGLRPLAAPKNETDSTKEISRSHKLIVEKSKLITITGGKWTTYRKMAEDTIDKAIDVGSLRKKECRTENLKIHGYAIDLKKNYRAIYGSDSTRISELEKTNPDLTLSLIEDEPYTVSEVIWAVRHEMARSIEDVLARRMRVLFLDAKEAEKMAVVVASIVAKELGKPKEWEEQQLTSFTNLTKQYSLN